MMVMIKIKTGIEHLHASEGDRNTGVLMLTIEYLGNGDLLCWLQALMLQRRHN